MYLYFQALSTYRKFQSLVKFIRALNILLNQNQKTSVKFYQAYILPIKSVLKKIKYQASHLGKLYEGVYRRFSTDLFSKTNVVENKSNI